MSPRPGSPKRTKYKAQPGRFSEHRQVWAHLHHGEWTLFIYDNKDKESLDAEGKEIEWEVGANVFVKFTQGTRRANFSLTSLTAEELDAFEQFINRAIEIARPIVHQRDEEARRAHEQGDDSFTRLYRSVPRVFDRTRAKREHGPGVRVGPDGVPGPSDGHDSGPVRDAEHSVAEQEPGDVGTQDG